ncbi:MAG: hypothetical protein ACJAWS_001368 [Oleiphilaceae bacterium]|jgi:hypothetical protein
MENDQFSFSAVGSSVLGQAPSVSFSETESDISYGTGLELELSQGFYFDLEITQLIKKYL